jgi:pimeloyl-ACP methyl ester carboxylesterase
MASIETPDGRVDYDECGDGPTIVLVPGSCSTGAAWRPVIAALGGRFRCVTTSLLGYGGTDERRTRADVAISHEAEIVEAVIRRATGPVHLVGHSFGGLVALAVARRDRVPLQSITIAEAPAANLLRDFGENQHFRAFKDMTDAYFSSFHGGDATAIETMIDFYGGAGTFAGWPPQVRAYAVETTRVNLVDWASVFGFCISPADLAALELPVLVMRGGESHPAVQRANELVSTHIEGASLVTVAGAAHFLISTHARDVARAIARHIANAEGMRGRTFLTRLAIFEAAD